MIRAKHVDVVCRCGLDGEVFIAVRDEGKGFDTSTILDPTTPENQLLPHGRGIYLIRTFMDKVEFHDSGTVIEMRKNHRGAERKDE